jgi:tetratricopeptide (TPR) repeat protein
LFKANDFDGAVAAYEQAIATDADYAPAHAGLALVYLWQSVPDQASALAQAEKAVELAPEDAHVQAVLALVYVSDETPEEAVRVAEEAVALDAESAFAQAALAEAYLLNRQYDEALEAALAAYELDPDAPFVLVTLGGVYQLTGDFARARAAYEQAIALEPDFAAWQRTLGWFWLGAERYDEARAVFEPLLERVPQDVGAHVGMARLSREQRAYEAAEEHLTAAQEAGPEHGPVYRAWGNLYTQQEDYDEGLASYQQALDLAPDSYYTPIAIGYAYLRQEECDRAAQEFQAMIEAQPGFADAHIGLGYAKMCDGEVGRALEYFRKAQELEPYNPLPLVGMADAYSLQERWQDAIQSYAEALRWSLAPSMIHQQLGGYFGMQQMYDQAQAEYETALALNPYLLDSKVSLMSVLWDQEQADAAYQLAQEAVELDASHWDAQMMLGVLAVDEGEYDVGVEVLEEVAEERPEEAFAHYFLGVAYCEQGQYREAKEALETYRALASSEETNSQLENLLLFLDQGYTLTEDKAIEAADTLLGNFLEDVPEFAVEGEGEERTMVVTVALAPSDLEEENAMDLFFKVGVVGAMAGFQIPRIDPPVSAGLLMSFELYGQPRFTVRASLQDLKEFSYGFVGYEQFVQILEFSRMLDSPQATMRDITRNVSELRELETEAQIPFEVLDREELRERLTEGIDAQAHEILENEETLLELLGAIEPTLDLDALMVRLRAEQVAGFYVPEDTAMYLIEAEEQTASDEIVVAHEYVHALQDQHFGLGTLDDEEMNGDQQMAFRSLVEGDATLAMYLYSDAHVPIVDLFNMISRASGLETKALDASPLFIRELSTFPYASGLEFVASLYQRGGWDDVNAAYENPPQSTEQVLHPARYWEEDTPKPVPLGELAPQLEGTWTELDADVMGELGLRLAIAPHAGPGAAMRAAEGWGGDRYRLLYNEDDKTHALVVRTTWDDEEEAEEFEALYGAAMAHRLDYVEQVDALVDEVGARRWLSDLGYVYLVGDDSYVTLVLATDQATAEAVIAQLP